MTTPKRCEVCQDHHYVCATTGKTPCGAPGIGAHNHGWVPCPDCAICSPPPPPRPDESEKELEKLLGEGADEMPGHHTDCSYRPDFKKKLKSLLLSYGKEREREMWLKCKEAVNIEMKEWKDIGLPMTRDSFTYGGDWAIYREGAEDMAKRNYETLDALTSLKDKLKPKEKV